MGNRTARDKARVHATRPYYCSCGKVVYGNGGQAMHRAMHERRGESRKWEGERMVRDGYRGLSVEQWRDMWTDPCPACNGTGAIPRKPVELGVKDQCKACGMSGRKRRTSPAIPTFLGT